MHLRELSKLVLLAGAPRYMLSSSSIIFMSSLVCLLYALLIILVWSNPIECTTAVLLKYLCHTVPLHEH